MVSFLHDPNHMYLTGRTLGDLHVYFAYCQPENQSKNVNFADLRGRQRKHFRRHPHPSRQ